MTSSSCFWYRSRSTFEFPYLLSNGAEIGTGVNSEALISNSSQKIRYNYGLEEKKAIFYKKKFEIFTQALLDRSVPMATP